MLNGRLLRHRVGWRAQRGLSIVEMMVGVAIGLIVVAASSLLVSTQLGDNRRLLIETQLQQDLRASMDIITRELRRVGSQREDKVLMSLWYPTSTAVEHNATARTLIPASGAASTVVFDYQPETGVLSNQLGFELTGGVIRTELAGAGLQELTDGNALEVTDFVVTATNVETQPLPCPKACPDTTASCWPKVTVRELEVLITARSRAFPEVSRSLRSNVRLRNDYLPFFDPVGNQLCPP